MLIDTHAHLEIVDDIEGVLARAKAAGVGAIVTIGTSVKSSYEAMAIAEKYSRDDLKIFSTVGIHPIDGKEEIEKRGLEVCISEISDLAVTSKKIVAVGEAGLDFYGPGEKRPITDLEEKNYQKRLFERQIKLANNLHLPIVIHSRNAWDEIFEILRKTDARRGVFHSFTGGINELKAAIDLGFYISFSGILTFKNAKNVQEAAKIMPASKILIETDSPYLTPDPFRGKKNEPANVRITGSFLANLRNAQESEIFTQTSENAQTLFKI